MTSPIRALRRIAIPTGRHRLRRPVLLPDEPVTLTATVHAVLDEAELAQFLDSDEIALNEDAHCFPCERTTAHAVNRDGSRRCWDCGTATEGDGDA